MDQERNFVEIENPDGQVEEVEIFAKIKSKRDDKLYVLLTPDKTISKEVNIAVGYIYKEDNKLNIEIVENEEELNYVYSLINNELMVTKYGE